MIKQIIATVLTVVVIGVFALCSILTALKFNEANKNYLSESTCIDKLIAQEVERSDIRTFNGTCEEIK